MAGKVTRKVRKTVSRSEGSAAPRNAGGLRSGIPYAAAAATTRTAAGASRPSALRSPAGIPSIRGLPGCGSESPQIEKALPHGPAAGTRDPGIAPFGDALLPLPGWKEAPSRPRPSWAIGSAAVVTPRSIASPPVSSWFTRSR